MSNLTQATASKSSTSIMRALEPFALCFTALIVVAAMIQSIAPMV